jgi:glutamine synthetase
MRHALLYGLLAGLLIAALKVIEYRWLLVAHSVEIYAALIAAVFAAVGIWLGRRLTRPKETVVVREVVVPAPATFRVLPWAPSVGWVLCDEYFRDGKPFHFSPRHLLKRQLKRTRYDLKVGLEVEWYLARVAEEHLGDEHVGIPGVRGRPLRTAPIEPGYSYHSETNLDLMQPVLGELASAYTKLGLPLRSIENEWGPGQVECTFTAQSALRAADDMLLFRTATRQVCRRLGCFATFMARPALKGHYASGWHLHQSLVEGKRNAFMPEREGEPLSAIGEWFLAGLLANAQPATAFATPPANRYRLPSFDLRRSQKVS